MRMLILVYKLLHLAARRKWFYIDKRPYFIICTFRGRVLVSCKLVHTVELS